MPFSAGAVWFLTNTRSPAATVTPSIDCKPDNVIFAVVATITGALTDKPAAIWSTYCLFAISDALVGPVLIVPVVVAIFVNVADDGTFPPITELLIVLLVIVRPD